MQTNVHRLKNSRFKIKLLYQRTVMKEKNWIGCEYINEYRVDEKLWTWAEKGK